MRKISILITYEYESKTSDNTTFFRFHLIDFSKATKTNRIKSESIVTKSKIRLDFRIQLAVSPVAQTRENLN
jgi:hypothetical protein